MGSMFAPPARRTTFTNRDDDQSEAQTPQRMTTGNLEAQNPFSDPNNHLESNGIPNSPDPLSREPGGVPPPLQDDRFLQNQQYYARTDPSSQPAPESSRTVFPPILPRRKFNKHIMIPSIIAVVTVILVVTLVVCYVAGAFGD